MYQTNGNIRAFTINRITNQSILIDIAKYTQDDLANFKDINGENPVVVGRKTAINKIDDKDTLKNLSKDLNNEISKCAEDRLKKLGYE